MSRKARPRLAEGATPRINVFQPSLGRAELSAVARVFRASWPGRGAETDAFERDFAAHLGVAGALVTSVSCCTEGLFQSMRLLDIGPGDEVVLPTVHFVGAASAVAACGARPVFCDVDPRTLNATAATVEQALTSNTRALLLLHYGGVPSRMDEILPLLDGRGVALVEDSACSPASLLGGRACGTFGEIGVWSFDSMKIVVTGDGGMVYCRDPDRRARLRRQTYLGLDSESGVSSARDRRWWEFEIEGFERRAILNDVAAAMGRVQLRRLPEFLDRRRHIAERYDRELGPCSWLTIPPPIPGDATSSWYFYWIQTATGLRDRLAGHLRERGIYTTFRYHPLHRVERYEHRGRLPAAETAADSTLLLPLHQGLSDDDVERVIEAVRVFGRGL